MNEIVELKEDVSGSPLYSEDLAPVPPEKRTWSKWDLAAIWVGMAVCIPTYLLASYMIKNGLSWVEALCIIILGNLIITVPMVLNGHAGVKYGVPFPVIGRASFGVNGIHIASVVRGLVACGWFGIQTWIGGLAIYAIFNAITGAEGATGLDAGKFVGFAIFWMINMIFIWRGTESIKWLEEFAAPILIAIGVGLIIWGATQAKGFAIVLKQSDQLAKQTAVISESENINAATLNLYPIVNKDGSQKAREYKIYYPTADGESETNWLPVGRGITDLPVIEYPRIDLSAIQADPANLSVQFRRPSADGYSVSSKVGAVFPAPPPTFGSRIMTYLLWLTAMVGFWATMAISIADITRYTNKQKNQVQGQFIGLPGTMALYSFVGIFVTCAAVINFDDILVGADAPWDPVTLLGKFSQPAVVIVAQIFMIIATLSTNIAANVIAPANAFSNIAPKHISFRTGGLITAILGIIICPWWLMDEISGFLIFVSGFLGPVLAILICDYFIIRKKSVDLAGLFKPQGIYSFGGSGFSKAGMVALTGGVIVALVGLKVESLAFLYNLSWFTGFAVAFLIYWLMMRRHPSLLAEQP
ncbi:MAG: NCS1 family nucleobase:cation symporter-1 [Bacteroidota bacterium]